jgi:adenosylhomocysteine nucleosidase
LGCYQKPVAFAAGFFYDCGMTIGILCAIPEETQALGAAWQVHESTRIGDATFYHGQLAGRDVVLVECGIGKVNAAFAATILCEVFKCRKLVFSGIAGGLDPALHVGDVVIGQCVRQVDYGRFQDGAVIPFRAGAVPFGDVAGEIGWVMQNATCEKLRPLLRVTLPEWQGRQPKIQFGTILTGDVFLNDSRQREKYHADHQAQAIEMEGGAVAQIAEKYGAEAIVIRALSDLAGDDSHLDFAAFGHYAATSAARLVIEIIKTLNA